MSRDSHPCVYPKLSAHSRRERWGFSMSQFITASWVWERRAIGWGREEGALMGDIIRGGRPDARGIYRRAGEVWAEMVGLLMV